MRRNRNGKSGRKGFTLPELLAVVAIIAVLVIVAVPGIMSYYQRIKITELDDSARTIFLAAQSELTAKKNAGEKLDDLGAAIPATKLPTGVTGTYYAVTDKDQLKEIVPKGSIDTELSENHYVVEIDPKSGVVYAVWYWEKADFDYDDEAYDPVKPDKDERLNAGKLVGYYGGEGIDRPSVGQTPIPAVHVINAEELALTISVPQSSLDPTAMVYADVTFISRDGTEVQIIENAPLKLDGITTTYTGRVALDTLKEAAYATGNAAKDFNAGNMGQKFKNWVKDSVGTTYKITPGDDFDVEVCVHADGTYLPQYAYSRNINSLFASVDTTTKTAKIAYGRHLQNLHDSGEYSEHKEFTSGVLSNDNITKAVQIRDINFAAKNTTGKSENDIYYWSSTYLPPTETPDPTGAAAHKELVSPLHPINNNKLELFDGQNHEIRNLYSVRDRQGGLFSYIENGTYQNIRIVNPHIHAALDNVDYSSYDPEAAEHAIEAGALAGEVGPRTASPTKKVTIQNCKVYNSYEKEKDPDTLEALVDSSLHMDALEVKGRSFNSEGIEEKNPGKDLYVERLLDLPHIGAPATVSCSGGLVGHTRADSDLTIKNCGASVINIGARYVGGLIGRAEGTVTIDDSYSGSFTYGNRYVGGLIGIAEKGVTINSSYAAGEIMLGYEKGFIGAGLLHYKNEMTATSLPSNIDVRNSYAAVKYVAAAIDDGTGTGTPIEGTVDGKPKSGDGFETSNVVGTISGTFLLDDDNYYVPQSGVQYGCRNLTNTNESSPSGQVVSSAEAFATLTGSPFTEPNGWYVPTAPAENPKGVTAPYRLMEDLKDADSLTIPYPYPMLLSDGATTPVTHYGDWLEETNDGIKLAYYEKYTDNTYGVYVAKVNEDSTVTAVVNTLHSGDAVVVEDGYRLVNTNEVPTCTIDGTAQTLTRDTTASDLNTAIQTALGESEPINVYRFTTPTPAAKKGYHTLTAGTQTFYYNEDFACEAFDVTAATTAPDLDEWLSKPGAGGTGVSFKDDNTGTDKTATSNVVIRSARQLANVASYTTGAIGTTAAGWKYVQLLDIAYNTYTGAGLTVGKETGQPQTPAVLTGGAYYGNSHTIQNLYLQSNAENNAGLFATASGTFTLDGIRLLNVSVAGGTAGANVGGLVGSANGGTITDCGIYAENATNYDGFTITGGSATGSTGGLIGTATNCTISSSFAAVKVSGSGNAGGFAGTLTGGTVTDCYAGGHTVSGAYDTANPNVTGNTAGGFVGQVGTGSPQFGKTCYSTCSVNGTANVGQFAGNGTPTTDTGSVLYATGTIAGGTQNTETAYLKTGGAIPMATKSVTAHPYDITLPDEYPYTTNLTEHYGDWIDPVMLGYVEQYVDDVTGNPIYGVYVAHVDAAGTTPRDVINTLQSDKVVVNDFYALMSKQNIGSSLTQMTTPSTVTVDTTTYNLYKIHPSTAPAAGDYYKTYEYNGFKFFYNDDFACEAFDVTADADADTTTQLTKPQAGGKGASAFEDSTPTKVTDTKDVVIRSARQLANVQKNTAESATIGRGWNYVQLLDIDFDKYTGTVAGGNSDTDRLTPAYLQGGAYRGNEHPIQNLYIGSVINGAGLFSVASTNSTIKDVTLCNVSVAADGTYAASGSAGGLVGQLNGSAVENCGIYVEKPDEYKDNWNVVGQNANGVGGLIGQITDDSTVKSSYAAVRVNGAAAAATSATNPVGGFVGNFVKGTISNCYAGGYVNEDTQTYASDSVNVSGNNYVGGFVGNAADSADAKFDGEYTYSTASVGNGTSNGLFAGNGSIKPEAGTTLYAVSKAFDAVAVVAPRDESAYLTDLGAKEVAQQTVTETNRYNKKDTDFPYASNLTAHHGDWIQMDLLGVYYDTVATGTAEYYTEGDNLTTLQTGTPGSGEIATDDGYMFLSTEDLEDLAINVGGEGYSLEKDITPRTFNGKTYTYAYKVPSGALNKETEDYYGVVSINGKMFTANFGFAAEIFDGNTAVADRNTVKAKENLKYKVITKKTTDPSTGTTTTTTEEKTVGDKTSVMIRSARQLANLGIRSNAGTYDATSHRMQYTRGAQAIQNLSYHQLLDIDYEKYTAEDDGHNKKLPAAAVLAGSNTNANHTPITLGAPDKTATTGAGGSFDGHEYVIRNLIPGQIRQVTAYTSTGGESEVLIESGLFGRVTKGALKNIQLVNATVKNDASKVTGVEAPSVHTLEVPSSWGSPVGAGSSRTFTDSTGFEFELIGGGKTTIDTESRTWNVPNAPEKYEGSRYIKFNGSGSKDADVLTFTTSTPNAKVEVWWYKPGTDRQICIFQNTLNAGKQSDTQNSAGTYYSTFNLESIGKWYLASYTQRNHIYKVVVTEPDENSVRSGALVGAVDPAGTTDVTIDNCGVYVEPENPPTIPNKDMSTEQRQNASKEFDNAYTAYPVEHSDAVTDAVGGLIGSASKGTEITNSFAAVKVTGQDYVGGFAGQLTDVYVKDCYSGGHTNEGIYLTDAYNITAEGTNGIAGGFVGQIDEETKGEMELKGVCYSTASAEATRNVGSFAGNIGGTGWKGFETAKELYAIAPIAGGTRNDESYLDDTITMRPYETAQEATPYDVALLGNIYPYMIADGQEEHHGDWSLRFNFVYYELYKDPSSASYPASTGETWTDQTIDTTGLDPIDAAAPYIGFYSSYMGNDNLTKTINTLRVDGTVYDSGYMIVSDAKADPKELAMTVRSFYMSEDDSTKLKANTLGSDASGNAYSDDNPPPHDVDVNTEKIIDFDKLSSELSTSGKADTITQQISEDLGQFGYVIPFKAQNVPCSKEFYLEAYINGLFYLYNPQFACEVINAGMAKEEPAGSGKYVIDYETVRPKEGMWYFDETGTLKHESIKGILIRSPWNLAGFARYSRDGNNGLVRGDVRKETFYQLMDVDYTQYKEGKIYDGNTNNRATRTKGGENIDRAGTAWAFGQAPGKLIGGIYEGYNHKIQNLYLTTDSSDTTFVGLFGELDDGAKVRNVQFEKVHVNMKKLASKEDTSGAGVYAGALAAVVKGGSTLENIRMTDVEVDLHKTPQRTTDSKTGATSFEPPDDGNNRETATLKAIGGAIGRLESGTIENLDINGVSMKFDGQTYKYTMSGIDVTAGTSGTAYGSSMHSSSTPSVGGAIGQIEAGKDDKVTISGLTVTDPDIKANRGTALKVGGVVGSADSATGVFKNYKDDTTAADRRIVIKDSGVYLEDNEFNSTGVNATSASGTDKVGGFAGFLGKDVKAAGDFAAVRVQGRVNVGGFAGHIQGSHIEDCYAGGHTDGSGAYSTTYNVVAGQNSAKAGGFAGWMDMAFETGTKGPSALYMTGVNYTTSSVSGTGSSTQVGLFAGAFTEAEEKALNAKMGRNKPVNYAGGSLNLASGATETTLQSVMTGENIPRQDNTSDFSTEPYDTSLTGKVYPYKTNHKVHHGDWAQYKMMGIGYWEIEDDLLRLKYATNKTLVPELEAMEDDAEGFDHESYDGKKITQSGYFTVYSNTEGDEYTIDPPTTLTVNSDIAGRIQALIGGSTVDVQAYNLAEISTGPAAEIQEWTFTDTDTFTVTEIFYVNPAYALAIERKQAGTSSTLGKEINPYEIRTAQQLDNIEGVSAANPTYFQQTHDIIADGYTSTTGDTVNGSFAGTYDGGMYRILELGRPLFNEVADATLQHMVLYSKDGKAKIENTAGNAAGLALSAKDTTNINNCIVAGYTVTGSTNVGGLIARVDEGNVTISSCSATNALSGGTAVGGLVGHVAAAATVNIESSYAGGSIEKVTETTGTTASVGGLVGNMEEATPPADPTAPKPVRYKDVYSYVDMNDLSGNTGSITYYGIGAGTVDADSRINAYWYAGMPTTEVNGTVTVPVTDADQMNGVSLAQIKLDTQKLTYDVTPDPANPDKVEQVPYDAEAYYEPNASDAAKGLENKVASNATTEDKFGIFPYAAFAMDADGNNIHYGAYPTASYIGLYYYETEQVTSAAGVGDETYHFDVYGGEIYNGKLRSYELIDSLCRDHHLSGEYAGIEKSGYGYFLPKDAETDYTINATEGTTNYTVKGADMTPTTGGSKTLTPLADDNTVKTDLTKVLGALDVYSFAEDAFMQTWKMEGSSSTSLIGSVEVDVNTAFAAAFEKHSTSPTIGNEETNPYEIRTAAQLQNVGSASIDSALKGKFYKQTHDVDGSGTASYTPGELAGAYDGGGYRILDLKINTSGNAALFASADTDAAIRNVILYSPTGGAEITSTNENAAGLIAASTGKVTIENCIVSGYTITSSTASGYVGGIAGSLTGADTQITNCAAVVTLKGPATGTNAAGIGGIAGQLTLGTSGKISDCYAGGTINGTAAYAGGIFGTGSGTTVEKCYSYMDMTGVTATGAIYALGNGGTFTDCYYLADAAHFPTSGAVTTGQGTGCSNIGEMIEKIEVEHKTDYTYVPDSSDQMKGLTALVDDDRYAFEPVVKITLDPHVDTGVPESREYYVHYGSWPEGLMAAGVAYVEKDTDGKIVGYQIAGYDKAGQKMADVGIPDKLCTDHHDADGNMNNSNPHKIQDTYYVLFETRDVKFAATPTAAGDSVTNDSEVMQMRNAINTVLAANTTVTVYKTVKTGETEDAAGLSVDISAKGSSTSKSVYYTNGYAGVSYDEFSATNPKQIRTILQLDNIGSDGYFQQTHDLYGKGYGDIYHGGSYVKGYDGQCYRIFDLTITRNPSIANNDDEDDVGLFAQISGTISNVILYSTDGNATITGTGRSEDANDRCGTGGLAGDTSSESAKIENCVVAGYKISGKDYVGGLVGFAYRGVTITNSAAVNDLAYDGDTTEFGSVGGLVGGDDPPTAHGVEIRDSYAGGTIKNQSTDTNSTAAGLVGYRIRSGNQVNIKRCYSYVDFSDVTCPKKYPIAACNNGSKSITQTYYYDPENRIPDETETDKGTEKGYSGLLASETETLFGLASADNFGSATSTWIPNTASGLTPAADAFPFPAVLKNRKDSSSTFVHYGILPQNP